MATVEVKLLTKMNVAGIEKEPGDTIFVRPELVSRLKAAGKIADKDEVKIEASEPENLEEEDAND